MITHWLLRCGDGENLKNSSKYKIWGISSNIAVCKNFLTNVKPGDILWFVKGETQGKLIAVATYCSHNLRDFGPLINISLTNEELGWKGSGVVWSADTEVHYTDMYVLNNCELLTHIKGAAPIRKYNEKCKVNLPIEYNYIVKYSCVTLEW